MQEPNFKDQQVPVPSGKNSPSPPKSIMDIVSIILAVIASIIVGLGFMVGILVILFILTFDGCC